MTGASRTRAASRRRRLFAVGLGLVGIVPLAPGCTSVVKSVATPTRPGAPTPPKGGTSSIGAATNTTAGDQAVFHKSVGPEQQFNVHLSLGRAYETDGHFDAALAEYQKALEATAALGNGHAGAKSGGTRLGLVHRRIGAVYDRLGRFAQAETHYRTALKASPDDPKVWNDAGYSYYLQQRWADSERALKTARKLSPDDPRIATNLGLTLAALGRNEEALEALSQAGGRAIGHANLGYLLAALGRPDEARTQYAAALALQPDLAPARHALAALAAPRDPATQMARAEAPAPAPAKPGAEPLVVALEGPGKPPAPAPATGPLPPLPPGFQDAHVIPTGLDIPAAAK